MRNLLHVPVVISGPGTLQEIFQAQNSYQGSENKRPIGK
jgi:hypothetical protein